MVKKLLFEIGACDGTDSLRYYHSGFKVYTFEPRLDFYMSLKEKTKHLNDFILTNKAVSNFDGETDFNICKLGGASSILPFKSEEELIKYWGPDRTDIHYSGITYKVKCTRLDTFIEENNLQNDIIDYIHIDAQGVDLEVLQGLGKYINNVQGGVIESAISPEKAIYINQTNTIDTASKWLTEHNFKIENIQGNDLCGCEYNIYFKRNQL
jgi:FkbM family methyltransferase